jgi:hypothetical protein
LHKLIQETCKDAKTGDSDFTELQNRCLAAHLRNLTGAESALQSFKLEVQAFLLNAEATYEKWEEALTGLSKLDEADYDQYQELYVKFLHVVGKAAGFDKVEEVKAITGTQYPGVVIDEE